MWASFLFLDNIFNIVRHAMYFSQRQVTCLVLLQNTLGIAVHIIWSQHNREKNN